MVSLMILILFWGGFLGSYAASLYGYRTKQAGWIWASAVMPVLPAIYFGGSPGVWHWGLLLILLPVMAAFLFKPEKPRLTGAAVAAQWLFGAYILLRLYVIR